MSYKLLNGGFVRRLSDGACIPPDPNNRDRKLFDQWVAAGNTPDPADGPTPAEGRALLDHAELQQTRQQGALVALVNMTPSEQSDWVDARIAAGEQAVILKAVLRLVIACARHLMR